MNKIENLKPFPKFCCSIGYIPTSYKVSMSYEEQLWWLCDFLANTVIPTINQNGQAVEELQNLYNELKSYVDNYFENLDVQEEINNKLDEMAESGQLTDIIAQYLQLAGVLAFDNVNDMKNATNLVNGSIVKTLGFYSYNDGGGAFYKIRTITNQDNINNINIFAITNSNDLIAELIYDNEINVLQIGCKNDDSQDISSIINYMTQKTNLYFPRGIYNISNTLLLKNNIRSEFFNRDYEIDYNNISLLKSHITNNSSIIDISNVINGFNMKNINLLCNSNERGINAYFENSNRIYLNNISIHNVQNSHGIFINSSSFISRLAFLNNIAIFGGFNYYSSIGIELINSGDNKMDNIEVMGCQQGIICNNFIYGNNWHIWTGCLAGEDNNNWWAGTRGINLNIGFLNNIYLDSAYLHFVSHSSKNLIVNNLVIMNDDSMTGSDKYDGSVFYEFSGTVNNLLIHKSERMGAILADNAKFSNVQQILFSDITNGFRLPGSRYYDINYHFNNVSPENKLMELAKIKIENQSAKINLQAFKANNSYYNFDLIFENGTFADKSINSSVGNDNIYITKSKTDNTYTLYIDMHSNGSEWYSLESKQINQMNGINILDLNCNYEPQKINYDSSLLFTII